MRLLRPLHVRLTLVFLAILLALGGFSFWVAQSSATRHALELTQRLNEPVARYLVENTPLIDADGLHGEALAELAPHIMTINPSAQVYLLDVSGTVIAQAAALNTIAPRSVSLAPIRRFLAGNIAYPLLGDDPLDPETQRPFSVWPITADDGLHGYAYVVLNGAQDASALAATGTSLVARDLAIMLSGALLLASLAGALVFFTLTKRLRLLTARVEQEPLSTDGSGTTERDEIDELAHVYALLTTRLQQQYARLARSDAERRQLIASVSHDLRTPLTTLKGYIETLQLGDGRLGCNERVRYLAIAHRHAEKLGSRVDELFELSRLTAEGTAVQRERFSLRELAHDCLQDFAPLARERQIAMDVMTTGESITRSPTSSDTFDICADIALMQRVFENLVDNALRHTPDGGQIAIRLHRSAADTLDIDVLDNGCGMPDVVAARVFDSCWSGRADDHARGGLGLAIVARAIELHGGQITVNSREGVGTCFHVELPVGVHPERACA